MYYKHPKIYHLPWSESITRDDKVLKDLEILELHEIVMTEKMDGENTSLYKDHLHPRSITYSPHISRNWIVKYHAEIKDRIPEGWRVCGENLYAQHSILYKNLESYFLVHSIWNEKNICLDWDETRKWSERMGLKTVPIIYRGGFYKDILLKKYKEYCETKKDEVEGYTVRICGRIDYNKYSEYIAKYVRKNHLKTTSHWFTKKITKNELIDRGEPMAGNGSPKP